VNGRELHDYRILSTEDLAAGDAGLSAASEAWRMRGQSRTVAWLSRCRVHFAEDVGRGFPMPTVLKVGSFQVHFYSDEAGEPPHIHVACGGGECKFWLCPVRLARNKGSRPRGSETSRGWSLSIRLF
jgi:hypothetical protein